MMDAITKAKRTLTSTFLKSIRENDGLNPTEADNRLNSASRRVVVAFGTSLGASCCCKPSATPNKTLAWSTSTVARKKTPIDRDQLQGAIDEVEGGRNPPANLNQLYKAVGKLLAKPPGAVKGRIEDYQLTLKTKPGRSFNKVSGESSGDKLDLTPFTKRGIVVTDLGDMLTSQYKSMEENRSIREAWKEIRRTTGNPTPNEGD